MKQFMKYCGLVLLASMIAMVGQARTVTVNADGVRKDLTQYLRQVGETNNYKDTVVLNFGKGTYTIDGSVIFHSHLVIRGKGVQQTTVIFNKGNDKTGFKAFTDDCFFDVPFRVSFYGAVRSFLLSFSSDTLYLLRPLSGAFLSIVN